MQKSTRTLIIVIGALGILSGVYAFLSGGETFDIIFGIFIGASLIGSLYFNKNGEVSCK